MFDNSSPAFLVVGYGATRRVQDAGSYNPDDQAKRRFLRYQRVAGLFEPHIALTPLTAWLPAAESANPGLYQQVRALLNQLLPEGAHFSGRREVMGASLGDYLYEVNGVDVPFGFDGAATGTVPSGGTLTLTFELVRMARGISRHRLGLYPYAREVLDVLRERYPLAIVSDAQSTAARGELHKVGLLDYFDPVVVSGDHGYRKPDRRLFQYALDGMNVAAGNALYVGNDMHRDIYGAREAGMTTVMFASDQGAKAHPGCVPDYTVTDFRDLRPILGLPALT